MTERKRKKRTQPTDTAVIRVPVFVSRPRVLNQGQKRSLEPVDDILNEFNFYPRSLDERSDYQSDYPLNQVHQMARGCFGGVILGFEQLVVHSGILSPQTRKQKMVDNELNLSLPTLWNHFEAGVLFGLGLPLLNFKESGVNHGIFDSSAHGFPVHELLPNESSEAKRREFREIFLRFPAKVLAKFYRGLPEIM